MCAPIARRPDGATRPFNEACVHEAHGMLGTRHQTPGGAHPSNSARLVVSPTARSASRMCSGVMKDMDMRRDSLRAASKIFFASRLHSGGGGEGAFAEVPQGGESREKAGAGAESENNTVARRRWSQRGQWACDGRCTLRQHPPKGQVLGRLAAALGDPGLHHSPRLLHLQNQGWPAGSTCRQVATTDRAVHDL